MKRALRLRKWAELNGFSYSGAYKAYVAGNIPNAYALPSGTIMVPEEQPLVAPPSRTAVYARVSSPKQRGDLEQQANRVSAFCAANGWAVDEVYREVASGLNDDRPVLNKLLDDKSITRIVVEHKDRLSRFGFAYIERLLGHSSRQVVVINKADSSRDDLMQDFVSVITSMTAQLYGPRRTKRKTEELIEVLSTNE